MTPRARIDATNAADPAVLIPYGNAQYTIGELVVLNVTLTAEDYRLIRSALGGGKRGRSRARELVPLKCPSCGCRLTHFDREGREPYFAATEADSAHGPRCNGEEPAARYAEGLSARIRNGDFSIRLARQ